jgi:hypothetical protein
VNFDNGAWGRGDVFHSLSHLLPLPSPPNAAPLGPWQRPAGLPPCFDRHPTAFPKLTVLSACQAGTDTQLDLAAVVEDVLMQQRQATLAAAKDNMPLPSRVFYTDEDLLDKDTASCLTMHQAELNYTQRRLAAVHRVDSLVAQVQHKQELAQQALQRLSQLQQQQPTGHQLLFWTRAAEQRPLAVERLVAELEMAQTALAGVEQQQPQQHHKLAANIARWRRQQRREHSSAFVARLQAACKHYAHCPHPDPALAAELEGVLDQAKAIHDNVQSKLEYVPPLLQMRGARVAVAVPEPFAAVWGRWLEASNHVYNVLASHINNTRGLFSQLQACASVKRLRAHLNEIYIMLFVLHDHFNRPISAHGVHVLKDKALQGIPKEVLHQATEDIVQAFHSHHRRSWKEVAADSRHTTFRRLRLRTYRNKTTSFAVDATFWNTDKGVFAEGGLRTHPVQRGKNGPIFPVVIKFATPVPLPVLGKTRLHQDRRGNWSISFQSPAFIWQQVYQRRPLVPLHGLASVDLEADQVEVGLF